MAVSITEWESLWEQRKEERIIMFMGMAESTHHKEIEGPVRGLYAIQQHADIVSTILSTVCSCPEPAAHTVKYIGDEVMLSFPKSEALTAVRCALDAIERLAQINESRDGLPILSKAGIAAGWVIPALHTVSRSVPDGPHGPPVDIAAQLMSMAKPGQILVEQNFRDLVGNRDLHTLNGDTAGFVPRPGLTKKIRGVKEPVRVSAVSRNDRDLSIRDLRVLRAELKKLEEALTDLMLQKDYILRECDTDLGQSQESGWAAARDRLEWLGKDQGALGHVRKVYRSAVESQNEPLIHELYVDLDSAFASAKRGLKDRKTLLLSEDQAERRKARSDCGEDIARVFEAAQGLQIAADKHIRRIDRS